VKADYFINTSLTSKNIDRYCIRRAIIQSIKDALPKLKGKLLDAGCGKMPYRQYILDNSAVTSYTGLDIDSALKYDDEVRPDVTWDGVRMPFDQNKFDCVLATEVLEHCPDPMLYLCEVYRVLKPEGVFFFTVPFLWPLHEVPNDAYRYTPFILQSYLQKAGFSNIKLKATGGWHASMAQMLGLWSKRSPLPSYIRAILTKIFLPIIRYLLYLDKPIDFQESSMITGISGIAVK